MGEKEMGNKREGAGIYGGGGGCNVRNNKQNL